MSCKKGSAKYSKRMLFPKESTRRLCHKAGAEYVSEDVYEYINKLAERMLAECLERAIRACEEEKKKTIKARHVPKIQPEPPRPTLLEEYLNK